MFSRTLVIKISGTKCAICGNPRTNPFIMYNMSLYMCSTCTSIFGSNPSYNIKYKKTT